MEVTEFMKLAKKLRLTETGDGQRLQGPAKEVVRFLSASGQADIETMFLGVYVTMMSSGLNRVDVAFDGEGAIGDEVMDNTQVRLEITSERLVVERIAPEDEEQNDD